MVADGSSTGGRRRGWRDRLAFADDGSYAHRPGELLVVDAERGLNALGDRFRSVAAVGEVGPFTHVRVEELGDPRSAVEDLRLLGIKAQPNHVYFADCDCQCPPHPSQAGTGASPVYASPVYASPVYASPVYASPVYASPVYASPVYASPVYASPVYASPVYASPVYASEQQLTGVRHSTARPATAASAAEAAALLARATGGGPRVVVLDTGLAEGAFRPAALGAMVVAARSDADIPDDAPVDGELDAAAGHGTFIAGLVSMVSPGADVVVVRVLHGEGDGDELAIANAILSLAGQVDVLNLSFSGYTLDHPLALAHAVRQVQTSGAIVVASAGNDATCQPTFPASLPGVVSVGAIGPNGPAPFTNYGPWIRACAPGVDLISSFFDGFNGIEQAPPGGVDPDAFFGWARWSGTSFAAPIVSGALARLMERGATGAEAVARLIDAPHLMRIPNLGTVVNAP
jgi:hypothetical protein